MATDHGLTRDGSNADPRWYDYLIQFGLIQFGPGAQLKFGAGLDDAGKITGLSFG